MAWPRQRKRGTQLYGVKDVAKNTISSVTYLSYTKGINKNKAGSEVKLLRSAATVIARHSNFKSPEQEQNLSRQLVRPTIGPSPLLVEKQRVF